MLWYKVIIIDNSEISLFITKETLWRAFIYNNALRKNFFIKDSIYTINRWAYSNTVKKQAFCYIASNAITLHFFQMCIVAKRFQKQLALHNKTIYELFFWNEFH